MLAATAAAATLALLGNADDPGYASDSGAGACSRPHSIRSFSALASSSGSI
jgi:hypothetical protein